jgi:hypothetical protein
MPYQSQQWLENYGPNSSCIVATECCGKGVRVKARINYTVDTEIGNVKEDEWGRPFKK